MKRIITATLFVLLALNAVAADFFSTEKSDDLFTFGVRVGVNTSKTGSNFVKDGKRYRIKHRDEHDQARKGMAYLERNDKH